MVTRDRNQSRGCSSCRSPEKFKHQQAQFVKNIVVPPSEVRSQAGCVVSEGTGFHSADIKSNRILINPTPHTLLPASSTELSGLSALPICQHDQAYSLAGTVDTFYGVWTEVPLEQGRHLTNPQAIKLYLFLLLLPNLLFFHWSFTSLFSPHSQLPLLSFSTFTFHFSFPSPLWFYYYN